MSRTRRHAPPPASPPTADADFDTLEADLARRHRRLARYLRIRGLVGLVLVVAAGVAVLTALWLLVAGPFEGFDRVLAATMPSGLAVITGRAGSAYWRGRHPDGPDTGCLVA